MTYLISALMLVTYVLPKKTVDSVSDGLLEQEVAKAHQMGPEGYITHHNQEVQANVKKKHFWRGRNLVDTQDLMRYMSQGFLRPITRLTLVS